MKAWSIDQHGGTEVLKWTDRPEPAATADQVIVRVRSVGLNHLDLWVRKGVPGHRFPLPIVPGCDTCGVIESFGSGEAAHSRSLKIGSRVLIQPGFSCGTCQYCKAGDEPLCASYGIRGETTDGGCAEKIAVPIEDLIPLPDSLSDEQAAALPIPYLTAYSMLVRKARVQPGELVLIQGGSSGVSVAALQICKMLGIESAVTVRGAEKASALQKLGASIAIDRSSADVRAGLKPWLAARGKRGFDVAIDHNGQATFSESLRLLAKGGRLATCGATTGGDVTVDLKTVFFKNISILGTTMGSRADLITLVDHAAAGRLTPVIHSVIPISQLPLAHALLESGEVVGKVVVRL